MTRRTSKMSAKRSAAATVIYKAAAAAYRAARKLELSDPVQARALYAKAERLLARADKSIVLGPVGRLPNARKSKTVTIKNIKIKSSYLTLPEDTERARYLLQAAKYAKAADYIPANKKFLFQAALELEAMERKALRVNNPRGLTSADIARLPKSAQEAIKRELAREQLDEQPIIRRPLRPADFIQLSAIPKGATKVRLKSGQVISRVRKLNADEKQEADRLIAQCLQKAQVYELRAKTATPGQARAYKQIAKIERDEAKRLARRYNPGLIDLAANLQAAEFLAGAAGGKRKRNPIRNGFYVFSKAQGGGRWWLTPQNRMGQNMKDARWFSTASVAAKAAIKQNAAGWGKDIKWEVFEVYDSSKPGGRTINPSLRDLSETFQGKASGAVSEYKAANSAPSNLARIGKLVFIKLADSGKQTRVPGAMVAVDQKGKLWIVGNRTPIFKQKAKPGEMLDYGEIERFCYETRKAHIEPGKLIEYDHSFDAPRPRLLIDAEGMPVIRGGAYTIKSEGVTG